MKVCIISGYPPGVGRGAEFVYPYVKSLSTETDVNNILVIGNTSNAPDREENGKIHVIRAWTPNSWTSLSHMMSVLMREVYDLVHLNYGYLFPGRPIFSFTFLLTVLISCRLVKKPIVVTINQVFSPEDVDENAEIFGNGPPGLLIKFGFILLNKVISLFSNRIIALHRKHKHILENYYKAKNVDYVPLPSPKNTSDLTHTPKDNAKRILGLRNRNILLIFGFVTPFKGIEYALSALPKIVEKHPDTMLVIAGTVPPSQSASNNARKYENYIHALVQDPDIRDHVIFRNRYINDREALLYFLASDAVILPNIKQSGPSEVLRVAMSYSIPVIATDVGYNRFDIVDRVNGLVVPPRDSDSLAKQVIDLITDGGTRKRIVDNIQRQSQEYSLETAINKTVEIYRGCLRQSE